jgi:hypothetical protein
MINQIPFHEYEVEFCREDIDYLHGIIQKDLTNIGSPDKPNLTLKMIATEAIKYADLTPEKWTGNLQRIAPLITALT